MLGNEVSATCVNASISILSLRQDAVLLGRAAVDAMEEIVARDYWPVPTHDDILFYV